MEDDSDPGPSRQRRPLSSSPSANMDTIAKQLALQVSEQLPGILDELIQEGYDPASIPWQLECSLTTANTGFLTAGSRFPIAAVDLGGDLTPFSPRTTPVTSGYDTHGGLVNSAPQLVHAMQASSLGSRSESSTGAATPIHSWDQGVARPNKRRKAVAQRPLSMPVMNPESSNSSINLITRGDAETVVSPQRKKRTSDNLVHQPSTLDKYISGVWESLYSGPKIDITEVVEQWQAIESNGQPKLLTDVDHEVATKSETGVCKYCLAFICIAIFLHKSLWFCLPIGFSSNSHQHSKSRENLNDQRFNLLERVQDKAFANISPSRSNEHSHAQDQPNESQLPFTRSHCPSTLGAVLRRPCQRARPRDRSRKSEEEGHS